MGEFENICMKVGLGLYVVRSVCRLHAVPFGAPYKAGMFHVSIFGYTAPACRVYAKIASPSALG